MVSGDAVRVKRGVHRAPCVTEDGEFPLIIKTLSLKGLLTEAICALVGRALGLPIPKPYWVHAPELTETAKGGEPPCEICFGSREEPHPAISAVLHDQDAIRALLRKWSRAGETATFDSWIANGDRSKHNLLLGSQGALWLIDHEDAMPTWMTPSDHCTNELLDHLCENLSEFSRHALLKVLRNHTGTYASVEIDTIEDEMANAGYQHVADAAAPLVIFLKERMTHLHRLLGEQVNPKQGEFPYVAPRKAAAAPQGADPATGA